MKIKRLLLIIIFVSLFACKNDTKKLNTDKTYQYSGSVYEIINDNTPFFTDEEINIAKNSYEYYGDLDELNRVSYAIASVGKDLMPTEKRGDISSVIPTGFNQYFDDTLIDSGSLYNRSHLIAYMLTGENANERNLITGTEFMNEDLMLPFEKVVYNYINSTGNHVLYRITPHYEGDNLVANYILFEALSIEDDDISFCFVIYNIEPCFDIDYADGKVVNVDRTCNITQGIEDNIDDEYFVLNTNTLKFHRYNCDRANDISYFNKGYLYCDKMMALDFGFSPCQNCNP